jgi:hypothetical protein
MDSAERGAAQGREKTYVRRRSALVIATTAVAARATASSAWAGDAARIVFQRFDPRIGKDRLHGIGPDGTGLHAITRPEGNAEWP